jgi:hypothetical protein
MAVSRRYQVLWWWRPSYWSVMLQRGHEIGSYSLIYRWMAQVGPLEIRRWLEVPDDER